MRRILLTFASCIALTASAQDDNKLTLSGSIQSDILVPQADDKIGAEKTEDFQTNTYVDLHLQHTDWSTWSTRCRALRTTSRDGVCPTFT